MKTKIVLIALMVLAAAQTSETIAQTLLPRLLGANGLQANSAPAQPSLTPGGYYPYIIARAGDREILQNTPIEMRPNRPLHFYGNMVRRSQSQSPLFAPLRRQ